MNEENELDSTCGVSDKEMTYRFQQGVKIENEIKQLRGASYCWLRYRQKAGIS